MLAEHTTVTMTPGAGRVTSARKIEANRRNARASTGPRTVAGKARAAQNARRHGLNLPARYDPSRAGEIDALARAIAGADAGAERLELASRIAAAQIDVERARRARLDIYPQALRERDAIARLAAIDRYEGRALSLRKRAMRDFDDAPDRACPGMPAGVSAERSHRAKVRRMAGNGASALPACPSSSRSIYPWAGPEAALIRSLIRATTLVQRDARAGRRIGTTICGEERRARKMASRVGATMKPTAAHCDEVPWAFRRNEANGRKGARLALTHRGRAHAQLGSTPRGKGYAGGCATAAASLPTRLASRAPGVLAQRRNEATVRKLNDLRRTGGAAGHRWLDARIIAALGTVRRTSGRTKPTVESARVSTLPNHLLLRCRHHLARRVDHGMDAAGELDCAGDVHVERSARIILAAHARRPRRPHDLCA